MSSCIYLSDCTYRVRDDRSTSSDPLFSIVVPTHNRPTGLLNCLQALCRLEYPADRFEVIIVDDGGEPHTECVAPKDQPRINVLFLRQHPRGPAAARNVGAAHARGKYLVFTDDDCRPEPKWLHKIELALAGTENCLMAGCTRNALRGNIYSTATQTLIDYLNVYYNYDTAHGRFMTSNNIAVSKDLFWDIGGFDITFRFAAGEDRDFCGRWLQHGLQVRYAPDCVVAHAHPLDFFTYCRQHFNYGRGAYHFHRLSTRRSASHTNFEPLSFYCSLILHPRSVATPIRSARLSTLMVISQVANLSGYIYQYFVDGLTRILRLSLSH